MLAKYGPWSKHVRVKSIEFSVQAEAWLHDQGKKHGLDYEVLIEDIQTKISKKVFSPARTLNGRNIPARQVSVPQPIMFFNDAKHSRLCQANLGLITYIGR